MYDRPGKFHLVPHYNRCSIARGLQCGDQFSAQMAGGSKQQNFHHCFPFIPGRLDVPFITKYPAKLAVRDAARIPSFAWLMRNGSSKARSVTNKDMVKPTPASSPAPIKCLPVIPSGSFAILRVMSN